MQKLKKTIQLLFWAFLTVLLLLVVVAALIQVPAVQKYLTNQLEAYLQGKFNTEVRIASVRLKLPESLALGAVYVEDLKEDTLLHVGELAINFKLNQLLKKRVQFDRITLEGGKAKLRFERDSSNLDFILNAFNGNAKITENELVENKNTAPWVMTFDDASLLLRQVEVAYFDEKSAVDLLVYVGELDGSVGKLDYLENDYQVKDLALENAAIKLHIGEADSIETDQKEAIVAYKIGANKITIENVEVDLTMPDMAIWANVGQLENGASSFFMEDEDLRFQSNRFLLSESGFHYDVPSVERMADGFDANHFSLENIGLDVADIQYDNLDILAKINDLKGNTTDGFSLKKLNSEVHFTKNSIALLQTDLETDKTILRSEKTIVEHPFLGDEKPLIEQLKLDVKLNARSTDLSDLRYFYPPIDSFSFFHKNVDKSLEISAEVKGSLTDLNIKQLDFEGLQSKLIANGKIKNPTLPDQLQLDISLPYFFAPKEAISAVLPDSLLPHFIQLPDSVFLTGNIIGSLGDFNAELQAITKRNGVLLPTQVEAKVQLRNIQNLDSAHIDLLLDTLVISKKDLLAYMPPATLPTYVELPDKMVLTGKINGPFSNLQSDLRLLTYRSDDANEYKLLGSAAGLFTSDNPSFDLTLNAANIKREELAAFLSDSLLPAYFQLPILNKLTGVFKGELDNFGSTFKIESNTGEWAIDAALQNEKYDIDLNIQELQPATFFTQNYLDSLAGFSFQPLDLEVELNGQGFHLSKETFSDFLVSIKSHTDSVNGGLVVDGQLEQQVLVVNANANEPETQFRSDLQLDLSNDLPELLFNLQLDQLDLQSLRLHELPFAINGHFSAAAKGTGLDTLLAQVSMDSLDIHFNGKSERMDSLLLVADMDNGKNAIRFTSDFFDANLNGNFRWPQTMEVLQQMVFSEWQPDFPGPLIGKTDDQFVVDFQLHRPEILTMGYVPTLETLYPFQMKGDFDNQTAALHLTTNIPYLGYQQSGFEALTVNLNRNKEGIGYTFGVTHADVQEVMEINNFSAFGQLNDGVLTNTLQILDEEKKERYAMKSSLRFLDNETYQFSFLPEQLLNYEKWTVSEDNFVRYSDHKLEVREWRFSKGESAIEIFTKREGDWLKVAFEKFDLKTVADIIKLDGNYLGGVLNGNVLAKNILKKPVLTAQLDVADLMVMNALLGNLDLKAIENKNRIVKTIATLEGNGNDLSLRGGYDLNEKYEPIDFLLDITSIDLKTVEPLMLGYLENMAGKLVGQLEITGDFEQPSVEGEVHFNDAVFDIEMLKARMRLGEQPIVFDANAIEFKDLEILDAKGNKGIVSSYILTSDYRNYYLQADVDINDFLVLNTTSKDNDLYYGKLLVDATAKLSGLITEPDVDVEVKTQKGSKLTYIYNPYSNDLESHDGVVEFLAPEKLQLPREREKTQIQEVSEGLNMKITVRAEVNEDLDFIAITDPLSGDNFEGKAKGDVVFVMLPDGTMELTGQLEAVEGKYLFTYQTVLRRAFDVEPGGTLTWTGDPFNPELDVDVNYQVRTSPYPLLVQQGETGETTPSTKQIFLVKLNIGGTPSETEIATSIEYPNNMEGNTSDSNIQSAITTINQDPSEQNTQAFSLILFNGFLSQNIGNSEFQLVDISGSVNNAITQQLNGLANRYIKFVEVDFGLDTYQNSNANSQSDFRINVKKRFLNDRLVVSLDGKTTTENGTDESSSQTFLNNVTVEYSLTPNGHFKIKLYNQRDYDDFIGGTAVKLGGALVFSKDFNGFRAGRD